MSQDSERGGLAGSWETHFDELAEDDSFAMFRVEAADYVARLQEATSFDDTTRVLDFGCGFGFVAEILAGSVGKLWFWDVSSNMRQIAQRRLTPFDNVAMLNLSDPQVRTSFDLILVNSVVQYMKTDELSAWLRRWSRMLLPQGRIVISDIIPRKSSFAVELLEGLLFAARHGFLLRSVSQAATELRRYWRARSRFRLLRMDAEEFRDEARACGLVVELLPVNVTYRRHRTAALLTLP